MAQQALSALHKDPPFLQGDLYGTTSAWVPGTWVLIPDVCWTGGVVASSRHTGGRGEGWKCLERLSEHKAVG